MKICTYETCERPNYSKGLCKAHYEQNRRGVALKPLQWRTNDQNDLMARLLEKSVQKDSGCLVWQGGSVSRGYGQLRWGKRRLTTHKAMFLATYGYESPTPLTFTCHNRKCINMDHITESI